MNRIAVQPDETTAPIRKRTFETREEQIMRAWREAQTADTSQHNTDERVNWKEIERHVLRLQRQLAHAVEQGKRKSGTPHMNTALMAYYSAADVLSKINHDLLRRNFRGR